MLEMNVFRILGDVSHTVSKCILIWAIHWNRSAEGVSLLTQLMYAVVFMTRYLDLYWVPKEESFWNFTLKILYILSSLYTIALMMKVFARTREKEKSWRLAAYINLAGIIGAPLMPFVIREGRSHRFTDYVWAYSIIVEAFCILPQLILLRQTTVPTVIDSYYLVTLGTYRLFYIINWIYKTANGVKVEPMRVIFGVVQIAFYIDFAWVYYSRQRVKLRGGGIVDTDDLRKGFLVNHFIDHSTGMDEESGPHETDGAANTQNAQRSKTTNRWGSRGISISADDTLARADRARGSHTAQPSGEHNDGDDAFLVDDDEDEATPAITTNGVDEFGAQWKDSKRTS